MSPVVPLENKILFFICKYPWAKVKTLISLTYFCSQKFIKRIPCLHLPTFRSKASIVSEKSTVFMCFSYRKAKVTKFDNPRNLCPKITPMIGHHSRNETYVNVVLESRLEIACIRRMVLVDICQLVPDLKIFDWFIPYMGMVAILQHVT